MYKLRRHVKQESRAAARKLHDAEVILFGLKFGNDIHYKLRCSQASIRQGFGAPSMLRALVEKFTTHLANPNPNPNHNHNLNPSPYSNPKFTTKPS